VGKVNQKVEIRWQESVQGREEPHDGFVVVNSLEEAWEVLESIFLVTGPQPGTQASAKGVLAQLRENDANLVKALRQVLSQDLGFTRQLVRELIREEVEAQLGSFFKDGSVVRKSIDALVERSLSQKFIGGLTVQEVINQSTSRLVSKWIADNLQLARKDK
jgi:hypothetical protein